MSMPTDQSVAQPTATPLAQLENPSEFIARHIGVSEADEAHMLSVIGEASRRALIDSIVPRSIARTTDMDLHLPVTAPQRGNFHCSSNRPAVTTSTSSGFSAATR